MLYDRIKLQINMVKLLNLKDDKVLKDISVIKNVAFYRDLLAFYDAYKNLLERDVSELPNYCFWNGSYCLEGICLFIKDYSFELGFESLKLSLEYLKYLYFYIASFSEGGYIPSRLIFEREFEDYKSKINDGVQNSEEERCKLEREYTEVSSLYYSNFNKNLKNKTLEHTFNVLSIFFLILGIFCVIAPFTFYFLNSLELVFACIISLGCVAVGITLFLIFKKLSHIYDATENGTAYEVKSSKNFKDDKLNTLRELIFEIGKMHSEKYDAEHNIFELVFGKDKLTFDEILEKAKEYSVLSYNIKRDCLIIFNSQTEEINKTLNQINKYVELADANKYLSEIYLNVKQKDWLYYNGLIRYSFISKFIEYAEKTYEWELALPEEKTPFNLDIKAIAKEKIAFLKNQDALFISSSIDKFSTSSYLKNQNIFKLKKDLSIKEFYSIKLSYITKFYDYEKIKSYNNLFYDKRIGEGARVPEKIIKNYAKVPTLILIRLKVLSASIGQDNTDNAKLQKICHDLFVADYELLENLQPIKTKQDEVKIEVNINSEPRTVYECEEIEEYGEFVVKYIIDGKVINGYKIT